MVTPEAVRASFDRVASEFAESPRFAALIGGQLEQEQVQEFVRNLVRTHYQSPRFLAFLFAVLPSERGGALLRENMLEEMGIAGEDGERPHPELLLDLVRGLGLGETETRRLVAQSEAGLRRLCARPAPFASLRETGLSLLLSVVAIEYFLSRYSSPIGAALAKHYGVPESALTWFHLHGEVDVRHAEEGIETVCDYAAFHEIEEWRFATVERITFAENVLAARYFPEDE